VAGVATHLAGQLTIGASERRLRILTGRLLAALITVGLVLPLGAHANDWAFEVGNEAEFAAAVSALRDHGGTIKLRRNVYRGELVVRARPRHELRIVGERGVRVESLLLDHAQRVSVGRLTIAPVTQDAWIKVYRSRDIDIHDVLVTAAGTPYRATVHVPDSSRVVIRRSEFRHCGDRSGSLRTAFTCSSGRDTSA
jgi:hypothetical protein